MSRLGKRPIVIPEKVNVQVEKDVIKVKGPLGELELKLHPRINVKVEDGMIKVERIGDTNKDRALHGLYRSLINNMVIGVTNGFTVRLLLVGVGYRAQVKGKELILNVGYSHPVVVPIPDDIKVNVEENVKISIFGIDKHKVGQFAANIRKIRPPEPYKGKGIRYEDEVVVLKEGKKAKAK